jgi:hypothetical protein
MEAGAFRRRGQLRPSRRLRRRWVLAADHSLTGTQGPNWNGKTSTILPRMKRPWFVGSARVFGLAVRAHSGDVESLLASALNASEPPFQWKRDPVIRVNRSSASRDVKDPSP